MINEITIGGRSRPVKFGFNTLAEFGNMTGLKLSDMQNLGATLTIDHVIILVWCALKAGARKMNEEFAASKDEVGDWLDEDPNLVAEMMNIYAQTQAPVEEGKKKAGKAKR